MKYRLSSNFSKEYISNSIDTTSEAQPTSDVSCPQLLITDYTSVSRDEIEFKDSKDNITANYRITQIRFSSLRSLLIECHLLDLFTTIVLKEDGIYLEIHYLNFASLLSDCFEGGFTEYGWGERLTRMMSHVDIVTFKVLPINLLGLGGRLLNSYFYRLTALVRSLMRSYRTLIAHFILSVATGSITLVAPSLFLVLVLKRGLPFALSFFVWDLLIIIVMQCAVTIERIFSREIMWFNASVVRDQPRTYGLSRDRVSVSFEEEGSSKMRYTLHQDYCKDISAMVIKQVEGSVILNTFRYINPYDRIVTSFLSPSDYTMSDINVYFSRSNYWRFIMERRLRAKLEFNSLTGKPSTFFQGSHDLNRPVSYSDLRGSPMTNTNTSRNKKEIGRMKLLSKSDIKPKKRDSKRRDQTFAQGWFDFTVNLNEDTHELLNGFVEHAEKIGKLAEKLNGIPTTMEGILASLSSCSSTLLEKLIYYKSEIGTITLSMLALYILTTDKFYDPKWKIALTIIGALLIFLNRTLIYQTFSRIFPYAFSSGEIKGFCSEEDALSVISALVLSFSGKAFPKNFSVQEMLGKVVGFSRSWSDVRSFVSFFLKALKFVSDFVFEKVLGIAPPSLFYSQVPRVEEWLTSVRKVLSENLRGDLLPNAFNAAKLEELDYEGARLISTFSRDPSSRGIVECIRGPQYRLLNLIQDFIRKGVFRKGVRLEPLAILLRGPSAIGKSRLTMPLLFEVMARVLPEAELDRFRLDPHSFVYFRMPEMGFWDGYDPRTFLCVYDDFGQQTGDSLGNVNTALEMIRVINNFETPLHMADLSEKSNTRFNSKIVLATTNLMGWPTQGIVEPEALKRRFDFDVTVELHPDYRLNLHDVANKKIKDARYHDNSWGYALDYTKVPNVSLLSREMYRFKIADEFVSWDCLIDLLVGRYNLKVERYESMMLDIPIAIDRGLKARPTFSQSGVSSDDEAWLEFEEKLGSFLPSSTSYLDALTQEFDNYFRLLKGYAIHLTKIFDRYLVKPLVEVLHFFNALDWALAVFVITLSYKMFSYVLDIRMKTDSEPPDVESAQSQVSYQVDINCDEICNKVLKRNLYNIVGPSGSSQGHVLFLKDDLFIVPRHYLYMWDSFAEKLPDDKDDVEIHLFNPILGERIRFCYRQVRDNCYIDDDKDLVLMQVPGYPYKKPNILKFFFSETVCSSHNISRGCLVLFRDGLLERNMCNVRFEKDLSVTHVNPKGVTMQSDLVNTYSYDVPTQNGDCGSVLFIRDPTTRNEKILGIHVAGTPRSGIGHSNSLTREYLEDIIGNFGAVSQFSADRVIKFRHVRRVGKPPGRAVSTSLRKSPLCDLWGPHVKEPASIRPFVGSDGDRINPFTQAISKYDILMSELPEDRVELAVGIAMGHFFNDFPMSDIDRSILTYDEAVCGIPGEPYIDGIDRSTSLGYPLCLDSKLGGKKDFLGVEGPIDVSSPGYCLLREEYSEWFDSMSLGLNPEAIFVACLKDELRELEKVRLGKTRLFFSVPVFLLIAFKQYFARPCAFLMRNRIRNRMTPGINVYGSEWDTLAKMLGLTSTTLIDGDIKGFDTTQRTSFHRHIGRRWIELNNIDPEVTRIRMLLWDYVLSPRILVDKDVYDTVDMMVSGMVVTLLLNCMYCGSLLVYGILELLKWDHKKISWLRDDLKFVVNGDDHILSLGPSLAPHVDFFKLREALFLIGVEYTPGDKSSTPVAFKTLNQVTYLKRTFRFEERCGKWVAPLSMISILEMPYWSRKGSDYFSITKSNVERAVCELSLHGYDVFQEWAPRIMRESARILYYTPPRVSWSVCFDFVHSEGGAYFLKSDFEVPSSGETLNPQGSDLYLIYGQSLVKSCNIRRKTTGKCIIESSYLGYCSGGLSGDANDQSMQVWRSNYECNDRREIPLASNQTTETPDDGASKVVESSTTAFANTMEEEVARSGSLVKLDRKLLDSLSAGYNQDIKDYLAKPFIVSQGSWGSQGVNSILAQISTPDAILAACPVFANKVNGFVGFRATTVFNLQVNANKFQQGRLIMCFIPQASYAVYATSRLASLVTVTQLPGVQLDAACDTQATLSVPYTSPTNYYDLTTTDGIHGTCYVIVYSPLLYGTGTSSAEYTLWAHFEDVELVGPTVGQSGSSRNVKIKRRARGTPTEVELTKQPLSKALSIMSTGLDVFSTLPVLSPFMKPAAWVTQALSGAAAAFGWSKPFDNSPSSRMIPNPFPYMTTVDGVDAALTIGTSSQNQITTLDVSGSTTDEMSFKHIAGIPAYYGSFTWSTSTTIGTQLVSANTNPYDYCSFNTTATAGPTYHWFFAPPYASIAHLFTYYRGSLVITFKLVKTSFHTGRLLLQYIPGFSPSTVPTATNVKSQYVFREIIDVSEGYEFTYTLPYMSVRPWQVVGDPSSSTSWTGCGAWSLSVLNTLQCPDTVSQSLAIIVETSMAPDFEVAVPKPNAFVGPFYGTFTQSGDLDCEIANKTIGPAKVTYDSSAPTEYCIGEQISSVRSFLKRASQTFTTSSTNPYGTENSRPFTIGGISCKSTDTAVVRSFADNDNVSYFGSMYAYNRGSMRMKVFLSSPIPIPSVAPQPVSGIAYFYMTDNDTTSYSNTGYPIQNNRSVVPSYATNTSGTYIETHIPHYNQLHSRLVQPATYHYDEPNNLYASSVRFLVDWYNGSTTASTWYRAIGDDFSFHSFLSTVPICYTAM